MSRIDISRMYYYDKEKKDGQIIISPSSIGRFFSEPHKWFRTEILGEPSDFVANNGSVIGTTCHKVSELLFAGENPTDYYDEIDELCSQYCNENIDVNLDLYHILKTYKSMESVIRKQHEIALSINTSIMTEVKLELEIKPNIILKGTCDRLEFVDSGIHKMIDIVDNKTLSTKPTHTESIKLDYKYQMLAYAYLASRDKRFEDYQVRSIMLDQYITPTKTIDARFYQAIQSYDHNNIDFFNSILSLIVETIEAFKEEPELAYLLFKDYRLKHMDFNNYVQEKSIRSIYA